MAKKQVCKQCWHERKVHSREGCYDKGMCVYNCKVKFMDKKEFAEVDE